MFNYPNQCLHCNAILKSMFISIYCYNETDQTTKHNERLLTIFLISQSNRLRLELYLMKWEIKNSLYLLSMNLLLLVVFPQCRNLLKLPWNGVDFPGHNFPLCQSPTVGISQGWVMWIPLVKVTTDITHVVKTSLNFRNHSALYKELLTVQKIRQVITTQNENLITDIYKLLPFNRKCGHVDTDKHG